MIPSDAKGCEELINKKSKRLLEYIKTAKAVKNTPDIKPGLRNADGTGVMVGVSGVGSAQGYYMRDGEKVAMEGELYYRGINVADIVDGFLNDGRSGFEETAYLLIFGQMPNAKELETFKNILEEIRELPQGFTENMILAAPSINIMNKFARSILALYSFDAQPEIDESDIERELFKMLHLIACSPVIVAHAFAAKRHYFDGEGLYLHRSVPGYSMAQNFLHSVRRDNSFTEEEARLLDLCMVLHAEHGGGNNSTFTCRVLTSAGTDIYSAISAAIGSLKGPLHGGANAKAVEMFEFIKRDVNDVKDDGEISAYLDKILRGEAASGDKKIYGMGHAVYTLSDPRTVMLKKLARSLAENKGMIDEFELIESVERLTPDALARVKGRKTAVCANVDMYSGFVYKMLGIPPELYTPLFAIARMPGWCAHRMEEAWSGGKIIRPAYKAIALNEEYQPLSKR